jgi:Uma2 family endonuclease
MATAVEEPRMNAAPTTFGREEAFFRVVDLLPHGQTLRIQGVTWDDYVRFDNYRTERNRDGMKITYLKGVLEFTPPSFYHERIAGRIAECVKFLGDYCDLEYVFGGNTTFAKKEIDAGLEPDGCFYIKNWEAVVDAKDIDLGVHPPPDLAIEVDRYSSSLDKFSIYADLGVPEIWRFDPSLAVTFLERMPNGEYRAVAKSVNLPMLTSDNLTEFLNLSHRGDRTSRRAIAAWAASLVPPAS